MRKLLFPILIPLILLISCFHRPGPPHRQSNPISSKNRSQKGPSSRPRHPRSRHPLPAVRYPAIFQTISGKALPLSGIFYSKKKDGTSGSIHPTSGKSIG